MGTRNQRPIAADSDVAIYRRKPMSVQVFVRQVAEPVEGKSLP